MRSFSDYAGIRWTGGILSHRYLWYRMHYCLSWIASLSSSHGSVTNYALNTDDEICGVGTRGSRKARRGVSMECASVRSVFGVIKLSSVHGWPHEWPLVHAKKTIIRVSYPGIFTKIMVSHLQASISSHTYMPYSDIELLPFFHSSFIVSPVHSIVLRLSNQSSKN